MLDESTGTIKLLSSDGTVVNPTSDAFAPTIDNLQGGDFLYSNDGIGFQNTAFDQATLSIITNNYGYQEYTFVEQTLIEDESIIELSGNTIGIISATIQQNEYIDVDKIICEITPKVPFIINDGPVDLGLRFVGQASGALGNIDIRFITAEKNSYVVQHANKIDSSLNAVPNTLGYDFENPVLSIGLSAPATIEQGGSGAILITVFYKIRTFGAEYRMP